MQVIMSETLSAVEWCNDTLREWESLTKEVLELRFADSDSTGEPSILRKARINRAEKKKATADIKASVASMIQDLMHSTERGAVTLEIPAAELDVRLTWNKN